ncbi:hypothetical protein [uncultured Flavobacterium sp.]|uniref:hypothetical protein n=1 Tax=uncultured Flavobacterium sp. TaxID=165435 RepID=UPI0026277CAE|nr:hypothetical protein [uncultured Flavobacterium sp.]
MKIISLVKNLTILIILNSCTKPTYCECEVISSKAISASVGIPSDVDLDKLEDCGDKVKEDIMLDMPSDQISIDYIQQVSYEMCKHGSFEGKGRDHLKYYPKSEK